MADITVNLELEAWAGKWDISDGEDIEYTADTLAEAYLYLAKILHERGDNLYGYAMLELQKRINGLDLPNDAETEMAENARQQDIDDGIEPGNLADYIPEILD